MRVLTHPDQPDETFFRRLVAFADGHYQVIFDLGYFKTDAPSKSQWNSLKKKIKRHDKRLFIFKEHDLLTCDDPEARCGSIEFGFFAH